VSPGLVAAHVSIARIAATVRAFRCACPVSPNPQGSPCPSTRVSPLCPGSLSNFTRSVADPIGHTTYSTSSESDDDSDRAMASADRASSRASSNWLCSESLLRPRHFSTVAPIPLGGSVMSPLWPSGSSFPCVRSGVSGPLILLQVLPFGPLGIESLQQSATTGATVLTVRVVASHRYARANHHSADSPFCLPRVAQATRLLPAALRPASRWLSRRNPFGKER
jgi:hypothetical protein